MFRRSLVNLPAMNGQQAGPGVRGFPVFDGDGMFEQFPQIQT